MSEAADFAYYAMEGYGGDVFRVEIAASNLVTLTRRESAREGGPIGIFQFTAQPAVLEHLSALAHRLRDESVSMRPDSPHAVIRTGAKTVVAPRPSTAWNAHMPLRNEVLRLASEAEKQPLRAIAVRWSGGGDGIEAELSNPGSMAVELDWKKVHVTAEGYLTMSATLQPGTQGPAPLPPANMTLGEYKPGADSPARIEPKGKVLLRISVRYPKPGEWKLQARYQCLSLPDGSKGLEGKAFSALAPAARK